MSVPVANVSLQTRRKKISAILITPNGMSNTHKMVVDTLLAVEIFIASCTKEASLLLARVIVAFFTTA